MTDGLPVLQLDKLPEVGQTLSHVWVDILQRGTLNSVLEKFAGKGGLGGKGRVTTKGRLTVRAIIADDGGGGDGVDSGGMAGLGSLEAEAAVGGGGAVADGEIPQQGLDVGEPELDLVNLLFTIGGRHIMPYRQFLGSWLDSWGRDAEEGGGYTDYWDEMRTRCRGSLTL